MELFYWLTNRFLRKKYPFVLADAIIKYYNQKGKFEGIVLVERKNKPFGWALPGGFVNYGESLEEAIVRETREETGLRIELLKQLHTYSFPDRDPRIHAISTVFLAKAKGQINCGSDAKQAKAFSLSNLPELVFDHKKIIEEAKKELSEDIEEPLSKDELRQIKLSLADIKTGRIMTTNDAKRKWKI